MVALGVVRAVDVVFIIPRSTVIATISAVISVAVVVVVVDVGVGVGVVPEIGIAAVWVHTQAIGRWCWPLLLWRLFCISAGIRATVVLFLFGEETGHRSRCEQGRRRRNKNRNRERERREERDWVFLD